MSNTLATSEHKRLVELEEEITDDLKSIFRIGMNLMEIRDNKLWRGNFKSFEDYCNERWQKGGNWARKMINAVEVKNVVPVENEWQARQLTDLTDDYKVEVFNRAVDEVKDPELVTGNQLKRIKKKFLAEKDFGETESPAGEKTEDDISYGQLVQDFESCISGVRRVSQIIESIAAQEEGMWIDLDEFRIDIKNIKSNIRMAMPFNTCPYCRGTGMDGQGHICQACRGLKWVPKSVWEEAPNGLPASPLSYDSENYDPDVAAPHDPRDDEDLDPGNDMPDY